MRSNQSQRGFLLIVAVVLIAVAATMAAVIVTFTAGSGQAGGQHLQATQALDIAEAGMEKAIRARSLSNAYAGEGPITVGQGTFTITLSTNDFSGVALPSGQRNIRSVGTVRNTTRTIEAIVRTGAAMMVYAEESSPGVVLYRQWNNDTYAWGARTVGNDVGPLISYMVLKFARTRNEAILGTMNANGQIHVQIWNGTSWGAIRLLATVGAGNSIYRGFDIEYETVNDRAVVVFNNANNRNPGYQIWDGTSWTATVGLDAAVVLGGLGGNYSNNNNVPIWIELASNPTAGSNNLALLTLDNNGTGQIYGVIWNGTAWTRISGSAVLWGTTATIARKPMDVAYEQLSGQVMFIWGTTSATPNQQQYRIWDGTTLTGATNFTMVAQANTTQWIRLVPQDNSDNMMHLVQDSGRDLNSAFWNGTAFGTQVTHDPTTENAQSRNFDFVFETHPSRTGRGWALWGNGSTVSSREWTGATWNPNPPTAAPTIPGTDDTSYIRLVAHSGSGSIFSGLYQSAGTRDIQELHQTAGAGAWAGATTVWAGPTVGNPVLHRLAIATERHTPVMSWREVFP